MSEPANSREPKTVTLQVELTFTVHDPDEVTGRALREIVPTSVGAPELRNAEITRVREDLRRAVVWNVDWSAVVDGDHLALTGINFLDLEAPGTQSTPDPQKIIVRAAAEQRGLDNLRNSAPPEMRRELDWPSGPIALSEIFIGALGWVIGQMESDIDDDIALLQDADAAEVADELKVLGGIPAKSWSVIDKEFAERFRTTIGEVAWAMRTRWQGTPTVASQLVVALAVQQVQRPLRLAEVDLPGSWFNWQREGLFSDLTFAKLLEPGFDGEAAEPGLGLRVAEWFKPAR
ncbi:hypothetical protein C3B44_03240 [Corynebacterium yudongzhengii]|uniref:Uncharacterized protein n=1 Tax=Corynebacterium yudongzhengii TaxID=2080740 RepID=A0A2U1T7G1_9CORY|nr:hypothetical protein [Corynebacterium yudongzhengii]AWB81489.1 hypothetical protein C3B44_03240 [Corynebacterium yudongzhengii]PWC01940.1 hypothetical protein DF222_05005 [Corynebacterium yudongzhengii]